MLTAITFVFGAVATDLWAGGNNHKPKYEKFEEADIVAAINFRKAAEENDLKRIIYLGGLGDARSSLSAHLRSRIQVARELEG